MVTHQEVLAGVTVLVSLSSLVFQGSGGDFPRRKAGCPSHGRQSFQAEELGKAGVQQRWPFCFRAAPVAWACLEPGSAPRPPAPKLPPTLLPCLDSASLQCRLPRTRPCWVPPAHLCSGWAPLHGGEHRRKPAGRCYLPILQNEETEA